MNNVQALWQMADEVEELIRKAERRVDWSETLMCEAQSCVSRAAEVQEQFVELLNKVLADDYERLSDGRKHKA